MNIEKENIYYQASLRAWFNLNILLDIAILILSCLAIAVLLPYKDLILAQCAIVGSVIVINIGLVIIRTNTSLMAAIIKENEDKVKVVDKKLLILDKVKITLFSLINLVLLVIIINN